MGSDLNKLRDRRWKGRDSGRALSRRTYVSLDSSWLYVSSISIHNSGRKSMKWLNN